MVQYEILHTTYDDDVERILAVAGLKDVQEVDPPEDTFPGEPVDSIRWIRRITETFEGDDLEVHSTVVAPFIPGATELELVDVSRLPNSGTIVINRGSATEESLLYTSRDTVNNTLTVDSPIQSHAVGEKAFPSTEIDFLGAFEVDLKPFGVDNIRGPIRHGSTVVILNGVVELKEGKDYFIVNDFVGSVCTRTRLRFVQEFANRERRFSPGDFLSVDYQFFVQLVGAVEIYAAFGETNFINVYETKEVQIAFGTLQTSERRQPFIGNISITPPFSNSTFPPTPVKVVIPDVFLPTNVAITEDIGVGSANIAVSDVSRFPTPDTLVDTADDAANRRVTIGGDTISYTDVDLVNSQLVGVSGITTTHSADTEVIFDGARYTRDVVKDAINRSSLRGQIEALSVDIGGRHLRIKIKGSSGTFNLQPGTYRLFYLGFQDENDRGLHEDLTTTNPFENRDLTFERHFRIIERREIAEELLGETLVYRSELTRTNPTDTTLGVP